MRLLLQSCGLLHDQLEDQLDEGVESLRLVVDAADQVLVGGHSRQDQRTGPNISPR
ncbi:MAG: hypothetical protein ACUVTG_15170 [Candidatus Oleimicrobiaceae bacterium]